MNEDSNTDQEYARVTALKIQRYNEKTKKLDIVYLPQFELIKFRCDNGKTIKQTFLCIQDKNRKGEVMEFDSEIEALKFAIEYRDKL